GLDHGHADAVLDAAERIEKFAFQSNRRIEAGGDFVQPNERRAAYGFDDVVVNSAGVHNEKRAAFTHTHRLVQGRCLVCKRENFEIENAQPRGQFAPNFKPTTLWPMSSMQIKSSRS